MPSTQPTQDAQAQAQAQQPAGLAQMAAMQQQMQLQQQQMATIMARFEGAAAAMAPPPAPRRPQTAHGGGGVRSGNHDQDYQLVPPQLAPRMHQRVAATSFLPDYDEYDSSEILYEDDDGRES
jgi:predicted 2-oxoglutarate/Fe(II)-dependent dioxygenase YbiX